MESRVQEGCRLFVRVQARRSRAPLLVATESECQGVLVLSAAGAVVSAYHQLLRHECEAGSDAAAPARAPDRVLRAAATDFAAAESQDESRGRKPRDRARARQPCLSARHVARRREPARGIGRNGGAHRPERLRQIDAVEGGDRARGAEPRPRSHRRRRAARSERSGAAPARRLRHPVRRTVSAPVLGRQHHARGAVLATRPEVDRCARR